MRSAFKTANKIDSFYSMLMALPVVFMIAHSALQLHNGELSNAEFNAQTLTNTTQLVERATSNYRPVVETTGRTMFAGLSKAASATAGCLSTSRVIHMSGSAGGCGSSKIKSVKSAFRGGNRPIHLR